MFDLVYEGANKLGLENVAQRNPIEEAKQSIQCSSNQTNTLRTFLKGMEGGGGGGVRRREGGNPWQ